MTDRLVIAGSSPYFSSFNYPFSPSLCTVLSLSFSCQLSSSTVTLLKSSPSPISKMRYTLLTVPLLAALTYAQLPGLPSCAVSSFHPLSHSPTSSTDTTQQNAATKGISDSGCGSTDVTCLCSKALSSPSLQSAIQSACSPAEVCRTFSLLPSHKLIHSFACDPHPLIDHMNRNR